MDKFPFGPEIEYLSSADIESATKTINLKKPYSTNQTTEEIMEILKDNYIEVDSDELDLLPVGTHVRYLYINLYNNERCLKPGGQIVEVEKDKIRLKGGHKFPYNLGRYYKDAENNVTDKHVRFFRKKSYLDDALINIQTRFEQLEALVEQQTKEINQLKKKLKS